MSDNTHPDLHGGDVTFPPDIDPIGDIRISEANPDKGEGLEVIDLGPDPPSDPRQNWILVPTSILTRTQKETPSEIEGEIAGYRSTIPLPFGTVRAPGKCTQIYYQNNYYYFVYCVSKGTVNEITKAYVDGVEHTLTTGADGRRFSNSVGTNSGNGISIYDGSQTGIDGDLYQLRFSANNYTEYTTSHNGYCYAVLTLHKFEVNNLPRVEILMNGLDTIWDPRQSGGSNVFTKNPALICAYLLTTHGISVNDTYLTEAADFSDEQIEGEARSQVSMLLQRPDLTINWLATLSAYGQFYVDLTLPEARLVVDKPRDPVFTVTPGMIVQGSTSFHKNVNQNLPDDVSVEYYSATDGENKGPIEAIGNIASPLIDFVRMPGFDTDGQAKRFGVYRHNSAVLTDMTWNGDLMNDAIGVSIGDVIMVTDRRYRINRKPFIVTARGVPEAGTYRVQCAEYQPNKYADSAQTEPAIDDYTLPDPYTVPSVSNVQVSSTEESVAGVVQVTATVSWDAPDWPHVGAYVLRVTNTTDSPERVVTEITCDKNCEQSYVLNLLGNTSYDFDVAVVSALGPIGSFVSASHTTVDDTSAPGTPVITDVIVHADFADPYIFFNTPNDADISYYEAEAEYQTIGSSPENWASEGGEFKRISGLGPDSSPGVYNPIALLWVQTDEYRFRVRAVDRSGNNGSWSDWFVLSPAATKNI